VRSREDRSNSGDAIVGGTQSGDKLGDRRSQDDEMPTLVWQKRSEEKKGQKSGDRGRRKNHPMGDRRQRRLGKRGRDRRGPQENRGDGPKEVFEVEKSVWESGVRENAKEKDLGSCYRSQGDV